MTAKRDLKRRVRLRQARTGESYVTARRRVMAARTSGDDLLKGGAKGDEESADDEPTGSGEPADERATAASSEGADATLPGVSGDDDAEATSSGGSDEDDADATLPGDSNEDDADATFPGDSDEDEDEDEAERGVRAESAAKAFSADEGGRRRDAAKPSAEDEARASVAAAARAEEEARASVAAAARAEEEARASAKEKARAEDELLERALAAAGSERARASLALPMGPATAAALMEAIEISAAMTMARAEGNTEVEPPARSTTGAEVVELREVTAEAALLGFRCRITVFPSVLEGAELATVLVALRNALVGPGGGMGQARMFDVAFGLRSKPAPLMVRPYPPTAVLTFEVAGRGGPFEVACRLWYPASTLILRRADDLELRGVAVMRSSHGEPEEAQLADPRAARLEREVLAQLARMSRVHHPPLPALYIVDGPRRHRVTHDSFVIGRGSKTADLVIKDGMISRKHAAVIYRNGRYYLKDLSSTHGIRFRGMLIDNKRIDEGDVFQIGDHELLFTFREER